MAEHSPAGGRGSAMRRPAPVQQPLPLETAAEPPSPPHHLLAQIATAAGTLEGYAVHVADEAAAAGFKAQAFELGMIKTLARRVRNLAVEGRNAANHGR